MAIFWPLIPDLIGAYGYCVDISRTWLCGGGQPNAEQKEAYQMAYEQIMINRDLPAHGHSFFEIAQKAKSLPENYLPNRYTLLYHGVGLCDEFSFTRVQR